MRSSVLGIVLLAGCGQDLPASMIDAPPADVGNAVDANIVFCPTGAATANVEMTSGAAHATYTHLHAGATWFTGPVAPPHEATVAGPDMSASLLFTSINEPLPVDTALCCSAADPGCCPLDGIVVHSEGLGVGVEVGDHPVQIWSFRDALFRVMGTLTITTFVQPFEHAPGRIAGSVSASSGGKTVTGTFDNVFCAALLTATI